MAPAAQRYHSLDALRAAMMLLGLVLHSAVSYAVAPFGEAWPYKDPQTNSAFDLLVFSIHLFRMPVFFVAAGFFAAMLMERDGVSGFAVNRTKRILVPLAVFWLPTLIAVGAGFSYAMRRAGGTLDTSALARGSILHAPLLAHLWFLWDLAIFCAAAALIAPLAARIAGPWRQRIDAAFARIAPTMFGALVMSAITAITLLPMRGAGLDTSGALLPPARILVAYGVFFTFGWLVYRRRDILEPFGRLWKKALAAGVVASIGYLIVVVSRPFADPVVAQVVGCAFAGLSTWMLIFGVVGAFVRLLDRPSPIVRYLSDASYWMYILHLPIVIAVPGVLAPSALPALVKFAITLAVTTAATLVTYHYLVRSTAIGALLNGRRYPRSLPARGQVSKTDMLGGLTPKSGDSQT